MENQQEHVLWAEAMNTWYRSGLNYEQTAKRRALIRWRNQSTMRKIVNDAFFNRLKLVMTFRKLRRRVLFRRFTKKCRRVLIRNVLKRWKHFLDQTITASSTMLSSAHSYACFKWISMTLGRLEPSYAFPWDEAAQAERSIDLIASSFVSRFRIYVAGRMSMSGKMLPILMHATALLDARQMRVSFCAWREYHRLEVARICELNRQLSRNALRRWHQKSLQSVRRQAIGRHIQNKSESRVLLFCFRNWRIKRNVCWFLRRRIRPKMFLYGFIALLNWAARKRIVKLQIQQGSFHASRRKKQIAMQLIRRFVRPLSTLAKRHRYLLSLYAGNKANSPKYSQLYSRFLNLWSQNGDEHRPISQRFLVMGHIMHTTRNLSTYLRRWYRHSRSASAQAILMHIAHIRRSRNSLVVHFTRWRRFARNRTSLIKRLNWLHLLAAKHWGRRRLLGTNAIVDIESLDTSTYLHSVEEGRLTKSKHDCFQKWFRRVKELIAQGILFKYAITSRNRKSVKIAFRALRRYAHRRGKVVRLFPRQVVPSERPFPESLFRESIASNHRKVNDALETIYAVTAFKVQDAATKWDALHHDQRQAKFRIVRSNQISAEGIIANLLLLCHGLLKWSLRTRMTAAQRNLNTCGRLHWMKIKCKNCFGLWRLRVVLTKATRYRLGSSHLLLHRTDVSRTSSRKAINGDIFHGAQASRMSMFELSTPRNTVELSFRPVRDRRSSSRFVSFSVRLLVWWKYWAHRKAKASRIGRIVQGSHRRRVLREFNLKWGLVAFRKQDIRQRSNRLVCNIFRRRLWNSFFAWRSLFQRAVLIRTHRHDELMARTAQLRVLMNRRENKSKAEIMRLWATNTRIYRAARNLILTLDRVHRRRALMLAIYVWKQVNRLSIIVTCVQRCWRGYWFRKSNASYEVVQKNIRESFKARRLYRKTLARKLFRVFLFTRTLRTRRMLNVRTKRGLIKFHRLLERVGAEYGNNRKALGHIYGIAFLKFRRCVKCSRDIYNALAWRRTKLLRESLQRFRLSVKLATSEFVSQSQFSHWKRIKLKLCMHQLRQSSLQDVRKRAAGLRGLQKLFKLFVRKLQFVSVRRKKHLLLVHGRCRLFRIARSFILLRVHARQSLFRRAISNDAKRDKKRLFLGTWVQRLLLPAMQYRRGKKFYRRGLLKLGFQSIRDQMSRVAQNSVTYNRGRLSRYNYQLMSYFNRIFKKRQAKLDSVTVGTRIRLKLLMKQAHRFVHFLIVLVRRRKAELLMQFRRRKQLWSMHKLPLIGLSQGRYASIPPIVARNALMRWFERCKVLKRSKSSFRAIALTQNRKCLIRAFSRLCRFQFKLSKRRRFLASLGNSLVKKLLAKYLWYWSRPWRHRKLVCTTRTRKLLRRFFHNLHLMISRRNRHKAFKPRTRARLRWQLNSSTLSIGNPQRRRQFAEVERVNAIRFLRNWRSRTRSCKAVAVVLHSVARYHRSTAAHRLWTRWRIVARTRHTFKQIRLRFTLKPLFRLWLLGAVNGREETKIVSIFRRTSLLRVCQRILFSWRRYSWKASQLTSKARYLSSIISREYKIKALFAWMHCFESKKYALLAIKIRELQRLHLMKRTLFRWQKIALVNEIKTWRFLRVVFHAWKSYGAWQKRTRDSIAAGDRSHRQKRLKRTLFRLMRYAARGRRGWNLTWRENQIVNRRKLSKFLKVWMKFVTRPVDCTSGLSDSRRSSRNCTPSPSRRYSSQQQGRSSQFMHSLNSSSPNSVSFSTGSASVRSPGPLTTAALRSSLAVATGNNEFTSQNNDFGLSPNRPSLRIITDPDNAVFKPSDGTRGERVSQPKSARSVGFQQPLLSRNGTKDQSGTPRHKSTSLTLDLSSLPSTSQLVRNASSQDHDNWGPLLSTRSRRSSFDPLPSTRSSRTSFYPLASTRSSRSSYDPLPSTRSYQSGYGPPPSARSHRSGYDPLLSTRSDRRFGPGFFGLLSTRSTTDNLSQDEIIYFAAFGLKRAIIIWRRYAVIRAVNRHRTVAERIVKLWREHTFRYKLKRTAFIDRLSHICRRWRLISIFDALRTNWQTGNLSRRIVARRACQVVKHIFERWIRIKYRNRSLRKCTTQLYRYFLTRSCWVAFRTWRVRVTSAQRIDRSRNLHQAFASWKLALRSRFCWRQSSIKRVLMAWKQLTVWRKRTERTFMIRQRAAVSLAKRVTITRRRLLMEAFSRWSLQQFHARNNVVGRQAVISVPRQSSKFDKAKREIQSIRNQISQNRLENCSAD